MDGLIFEDSQSFGVIVLEPEAKATPLATAKSTFEILTLTTETKCGISQGKVKQGLEIVRCSCGKDYHSKCGMRVGKCPGCSLEFKEKEAPEKEDDIGSLGSTPSPQAPSAEAPRQPAPSEPAAPAQQAHAQGTPAPEQPDDNASPADGEEPKKVAKKKVALKF
jgi:hypothetical protein